jgi:amino acid efflux transporter
MNEKKLSLFSGTSYAVGSIVGSGILFLPSLTYKVSGSDVFLSWLLATVLCVPLLIMFYDMSKILKSNDGVKGFIELGLGKNIGACFPALMLSTVSIGMPSSALIVGKFVKEYFGLNGLDYVVAFYLLAFGIGSNLFDKSIGTKIQNFVSVAFVIIGVVLFFLTAPQASGNYSKIIPIFNFSQTFAGITMAFWAFAGFENLTFITQDFENPKKDFFRAMLIALVICGFLYLALTANYAAIIPYDSIQGVMGLFQLSTVIEPRIISSLVVVALAFFALKTNFNSWVRGLSSMIIRAASTGHLPKTFELGNNSIYLLGGLFSLSLMLSLVNPDFLEVGLVIVSSNFVVIYVLCTLSFLRVNNSLLKKTMALVTLAFLVASLTTSKEKLIYPAIIMGVSYLIFRLRSGRSLAVCFSLLALANTAQASPKVIDIAVILREDDGFNQTTRFLEKGLELAKAEYEKAGKLKVNFKKYFHTEKLSTVMEAAQKAVKEGSYIIIGGENSDEAMAISEVIAGKEIVLVTPTSTNPKVTLGKPFVFRSCVSDDKVADKLAAFVFSELKSKRVGILHNVSYPYSDYLSKRFNSRINELIANTSSHQSNSVRVVEKRIVRNQPNFSQEIEFFKKQGVTHLVLLSFQSDLVRFQSQAMAAQFQPQYIGSDGWGLNEAIQKQILGSNPRENAFVGYRNMYWDGTSSTPANLAFKDAFKRHFNTPANAWAAVTYDTATFIFESFLSIDGKANGSSLQRELRKYKGKSLVTSERFSFDENNTPDQDVVIYRIDKNSAGFYGKL